MLFSPSRLDMKDKMFSIPGPLSMSLIGILRPIQREPMGVAAIGIQFPDLRRTAFLTPDTVTRIRRESGEK